ncbi:DnaB-like helicase N-terminal domain-containing protein, partial [Acinetobacter baumannii]
MDTTHPDLVRTPAANRGGQAATSPRSDLAAPQPLRNEEAEQGLLGAILFDNKVYEKVNEYLLPSHFYDPAHGRIFD